MTQLGMFEEYVNPWVRKCNTDKSDCRTMWRKSRTAYVDEDTTLAAFLTRIGAWEKPKPEEAAPAEAAPAAAGVTVPVSGMVIPTATA
eukprot:CAMPEP_0196718348 /NCGR_PEP_ID=MMETSP1091-20130531/1560_1 /TAXON_ID=302021 /ORGANISM="Rhodomonas sp., Strain CCMP768" /LENGTH=87 /DNA_ID=CAMNT_0042058975 /DNA_START=43 /DNA_END=306 /DNA_ORIENTATION=-